MPQKRLFSHNGVTVDEIMMITLPGMPSDNRYIVDVDNRWAATFTRKQWETLAEYFTADCSSECEGPRLDQPMPVNWRWGTD